MPGTAVPIAPLEVEVAGGLLATYRLGPADATPVLAVHGITGNSHSWIPVARALDGEACLIAPDLRGRGASNGLPPDYGSAAYVADLFAIVEQLEIERLVVAGHSLGAYIVSRFAVEHPDRVSALVLVDGGLTIPGSENVDPQKFVDGFLGPALARLSMHFASRAAYHEWWRAHPAFAGYDVAPDDFVAYIDHDLTGEAPELHSTVLEEAVRVDAMELPTIGSWARRLTHPAVLLSAPRGLIDDPHPMQPAELVGSWAADSPKRSWRVVEDTNHYTIALGAHGAAEVGDTIASALASAS